MNDAPRLKFNSVNSQSPESKKDVKFRLKKLRDYYNSKKHLLDLWIRGFQATAFVLTFIIATLGTINLFKASSHTGITQEFALELFKTLIEILITIYFFLSGIIGFTIPWLLDPMSDFYATLLKIKEGTTPTPKELEDGFEINSNVTMEDVAAIGKLAVEAWGTEQFYSPTRLKLYKRWYRANPNIFSLIMKDKEPIGFICVLPLNSALHFNLQLSKNNIDKTLIHSYPNLSNYVWIEGIYLKENHQHAEVLVRDIFHELLRKIVLFGRKDYVRVYSQVYYKSIKHFFIENGFGKPAKEKGKLEIRYLPMNHFKELEQGEDYYDDDYGEFGCNAEKSKFFFKNLKYVIDSEPGAHEQPGEDKLLKDLPYATNLNEFFATSFCNIEEAVKNENIHIHNRFLGKTYRIYTHAVYQENRGKLREHTLAISIIKFDKVAHGHFIGCRFYTGTKLLETEYIYNGICLFSNDKRDILMIFHPERLLRHKGQLSKHLGTLGDPPIIITGRIIDRDYKDILVDENKEGLLSLNLTTYSQHTESTISKIGLLHIDEGKQAIPAPGQYFEKLDPDEKDLPILKTIKLYLMRGNKVIIKGADKIVINNKNDIEKWMTDSYKTLERKTNINYELYYYKNRNENEIMVGAAHITFMMNGIARLTRTCKSTNFNGVETDVAEQYYGEVNIRYNETHKKFLYIKFIEMDIDKESLFQHYRELFLLLFWPDNDRSDFDYTRGIIMGDRDVEDSSQEILGANICALCNPTGYWDKHINNYPKEATDGDLAFTNKKLENVDKLFLQKIIPRGVISKVTKANETVGANKEETMMKLASFIEIEFNRKLCNYATVF